MNHNDSKGNKKHFAKPRKNTSELYKVGQILNVQMVKPKEGKFPIGRTDNGIICKIKIGSKGFFEYDSTWESKVVEVHEKKLIIEPVTCIVSAVEEHRRMGEKLNSLKTEKPKREKEVRNYQYKRKDEK